MALTDKLTAIANAVRSKTGSSEPLTLDQMATKIDAIQTGGSGGSSSSVTAKDVNFYDYDGTLLHSYTLAEAQALSELPPLPEQPGLICQGWNWSLEDIKAHNRAVDVGATYTTDDGTTRIYIRLHEGRTSPMLGVCPQGTVTVDWGDGTTPDVLTGTSVSTVQWTPTHNYAEPGDYIITLTVDGKMGFGGNGSTNGYAYILRHASGADGRNRTYQNAVHRVEIGNGVTSIGNNALYCCSSLTSINIPDGVTSISDNAFYNCYSLTSINIPDGVTSIGNSAFYNCYSLTSINIPDGVTSIGNNALYCCSSLTSINIPDSVTSIGNSAFYNCSPLTSINIPDGVTSISDNAFNYCYSLTSINIPDSVTSIGTYSFNNCFGVRCYDFSNHTTVPTLSNTNAFRGIPDDCEIRVPAALYDEWIAATNWSTYASNIVAV